MRPPLRSLALSAFFLFALLFALWPTAPLCATPPAGPPANAALLRISVLDVGQGDAILIQAPNGKTVLIDAGPGGRSELLLKQLELLGVQKINMLISSHPHEDHIGGMAALLEKVDVVRYGDSGQANTTGVYKLVMMKLQERGITANRLTKGGAVIKLDEKVRLEPLGPPVSPIQGTESDHNNNSVVLRLTFDDFSMLLPGDGQVEAERELLKSGLGQTTVLKVGHHGSRSSTTADLVDALAPQLAVISCEVGNDYGHPHPKTMETLQKRHIPVYRTDQQGMVQLVTDGHKLWVQLYPRAAILAAQPGAKLQPGQTDGPIEVRENPTPPATARPEAAAESADRGVAQSTGEKPGKTTKPKDEKKTPAAKPEPGVTALDMAGEETAPAPSAEGGAAYVASQKSKVFHKATCGNAKRITEQNRVTYPTREAAEAAGKTPAQDCKP